LLDPLTIQDIGLSAGHILDMTGIDQEYFKTSGFQDFVASVDPNFILPGAQHQL